MKKKIKLKDLSQKENVKWCEKNCVFYGNDWNCNECIFYSVMCVANKQKNWIYHKDLYSDKFLDQEIEIEVPDILDKEEKEYLSAVIKPFRNETLYINKYYGSNNMLYISIRYNNRNIMNTFIPIYKNDEKKYDRMELNKAYTLEELGL